jgi:hypothetical protein
LHGSTEPQNEVPEEERGTYLIFTKNEPGFPGVLIDDIRREAAGKLLDFVVENCFGVNLGAARHRHSPGGNFLQENRAQPRVQDGFLTAGTEKTVEMRVF